MHTLTSTDPRDSALIARFAPGDHPTRLACGLAIDLQKYAIGDIHIKPHTAAVTAEMEALKRHRAGLAPVQ